MPIVEFEFSSAGLGPVPARSDTAEWSLVAVEVHRMRETQWTEPKSSPKDDPRTAAHHLYDDLTDDKLTPIDAVFWAVMGGLSATGLWWILGWLR